MSALYLSPLSISGDEIVVRDARGRSVQRPALRQTARGLRVDGEFSVLQRFTVAESQGLRFVEVCRDDNPIHRGGGVLPGAMTAARLVLLPELLVQGFTSEHLKVKFRSIARYASPTLHRFRARPIRVPASGSPANGTGDPASAEVDGLEFFFEAIQDGQVVAEGVIRGSCRRLAGRSDRTGLASLRAAELPSVEHPEHSPEIASVHGFLSSLSLDPHAYLRHGGAVYPRAFLASLPSGEMVRQLEGEGGLLNSLSLDFTAGAAPIAVGASPSVEVESGPKRKGSAFRRVMTRVIQGVRVRCQGFATVFLEDELVADESRGIVA